MMRAAPRTQPWQRTVAAALACLACSCAFADGLKIKDAADAWPKWQARLGVVTGVSQANLGDESFKLDSLGATSLARLSPSFSLQSRPEAPRAAALLGDYYFTGSGLDPARMSGGLRATTGWLFGGTAALAASTVATASPWSTALQRAATSDDARPGHAAYLGLGYTGLHKSGLGFAADVGFMGTRWTGPRLGNDYVVRDLRLTPAARLGVSYAF
jgi:hypothetical protein